MIICPIEEIGYFDQANRLGLGRRVGFYIPLLKIWGLRRAMESDNQVVQSVRWIGHCINSTFSMVWWIQFTGWGFLFVQPAHSYPDPYNYVLSNSNVDACMVDVHKAHLPSGQWRQRSDSSDQIPGRRCRQCARMPDTWYIIHCTWWLRGIGWIYSGVFPVTFSHTNNYMNKQNREGDTGWGES